MWRAASSWVWQQTMGGEQTAVFGMREEAASCLLLSRSSETMEGPVWW
jgi:hypothetical protein